MAAHRRARRGSRAGLVRRPRLATARGRRRRRGADARGALARRRSSPTRAATCSPRRRAAARAPPALPRGATARRAGERRGDRARSTPATAEPRRASSRGDPTGDRRSPERTVGPAEAGSELADDDRVGVERGRSRRSVSDTPNVAPLGSRGDRRRIADPERQVVARRTSCRRPALPVDLAPSSGTPGRPAAWSRPVATTTSSVVDGENSERPRVAEPSVEASATRSTSGSAVIARVALVTASRPAIARDCAASCSSTRAPTMSVAGDDRQDDRRGDRRDPRQDRRRARRRRRGRRATGDRDGRGLA